MKILVAADGSAYTQRMLDYLAAHDEWLGKRHEYTVLNVVPAIPPHAASALSKDMLDTYYQDESDKVFAPVRTFFQQHGLDARFERRVGHAADEIAKLAKSGGYDLIAMGSRGHGSWGGLVMGSVATKVLGLCGTPVLLIR